MGKIKGKFAETYDRFVKRPNLLPDGFGKLVQSQNTKNILEFASGTGTVAIGLSLEGYDVTGIDYSPDMLKAARRKAREYKASVKFIRGDISKANLNRKFDLLLCLGNTVPHFKTQRELKKLLTNCGKHLRQGGRLIIQQLNYDRILKERPQTFAVDVASEVVRFKQYIYKKDRLGFIVTVVDGGKVPPAVTTTKIILKPWTRREFTEVLKQTGFGEISAYGNYGKERFSTKSKDLIIVASSK
jgi:glycine/sarcosine N-methyltransferase